MSYFVQVTPSLSKGMWVKVFRTSAVFFAAAIFVSGVFVADVQAVDTPCSGDIGSPLLVDVTQQFTNDPDSGVHGNWAMDAFVKHIQVWLGTDGTTYCGQTTDSGTFVTNGTITPEAGSPLPQIINGTFTGGARYIINGVFLEASSTWPLSGSAPENTCGGDGSACPSGTYSQWLSEYFSGESHSFVNWSWTYISTLGESWTNADTGNTGDISSSVINSTTHVGYSSIQNAIDAASDGDIITLGANATTTSRINVAKAITIDGNGHTLYTGFAKTSNSNNAAIGITHPDVTIKNLIVDGTAGTNLHGINVYESTGVILDTVTISGNGNGAAVIVNGSTVNATNLNTSGNTWGAVNVDPGFGVTAASVFTLNSGNLAEGTQIWSDGNNVSASSTVTVNAAGYSMYAIGGETTPFFIWTNRPLTDAATITRDGISTLYTTIQSAIDAATSGDTINVAAGTYDEAGQVLIDKNLTITGDSNNKPVIRPTANRAGVSAGDAWFLIAPGVTFNLNNVVLDGDAFFVWQAIRSHGTAVINGVDFRNIQGSLNGSPYRGFAVLSFGGTVPGGGGSDSHGSGGAPSVLTVTSSNFQQIGRVGILIKGDGSTATISGNTYAGKGNGDFLDYAFEVGAGGSATIENNTISGNRGVASSDGSTSAGILVTDYYGTGTDATITGNAITNNTDGIAVGYDSSDASAVVAHNNRLTGNGKGINSTNPAVDATSNWWGTVDSTEIASNVSSQVIYQPYCATSACSSVYSVVESNGSLLNGVAIGIATSTGATATSTPSLTILEEVSFGAGTSTITLPPNVVITRTDGEDLDVTALTSASADTDSLADLGEGVVTDGALQWGIEGLGLEFSEPVALKIYVGESLNGQLLNIVRSVTGTGDWTSDGITPPASCVVASGFCEFTATKASYYVTGYFSAITDAASVIGASTATLNGAITTVNGWDDATERGFEYGPSASYGRVVKEVGTFGAGTFSLDVSGLACQTEHRFRAYAKNDTGTVYGSDASFMAGTCPNTGSGGGGGGGALAAATPPAAVVTVPTTLPTPAVTPAPGEVLGAATFRFTATLRFGSEGDDITELQNRLTAEGVYAGPITGYFGPFTEAGVKAFQAKYGIEQAGIVGPLTRAQLNSTVAKVVSTSGEVLGVTTTNVEAVKARISLLQAQLITLLQQLMQTLQAQVR